MSAGRESKGSGGCFRCMCWCCCLVFLLIVIAVGFAYYVYITESPRAPTYDIQSVTPKGLHIRRDFSLKTEFEIKVMTKNPNKNIAFVYGENSNVSVLYNDVIISSGKLPSFRQDAGETTTLKIILRGASPNESGSLQDDLKHGKDYDGIPLVVNVKVPMKVYVGNVDLKDFMASVRCDLVVDYLKNGKTATVLENDCESEVDF